MRVGSIRPLFCSFVLCLLCPGWFVLFWFSSHHFSELVYALADLVHSFDAFISKVKNSVILQEVRMVLLYTVLGIITF